MILSKIKGVVDSHVTIHSICERISPRPYPSLTGHWRWQVNALFALQQAAEFYLVGLFSDCVLLAIHCKRVMVMRDDIPFVLRLRCKQSLGPPHADT